MYRRNNNTENYNTEITLTQLYTQGTITKKTLPDSSVTYYTNIIDDSLVDVVFKILEIKDNEILKIKDGEIFIGQLTNYGEIINNGIITGNTMLQNYGSFINNNFINITNRSIINNGEFINSGVIELDKDANIYNYGNMINNDTIIMKDDCLIEVGSAIITNNGYIKYSGGVFSLDQS